MTCPVTGAAQLIQEVVSSLVLAPCQFFSSNSVLAQVTLQSAQVQMSVEDTQCTVRYSCGATMQAGAADLVTALPAARQHRGTLQEVDKHMPLVTLPTARTHGTLIQMLV